MNVVWKERWACCMPRRKLPLSHAVAPNVHHSWTPGSHNNGKVQSAFKSAPLCRLKTLAHARLAKSIGKECWNFLALDTHRPPTTKSKGTSLALLHHQTHPTTEQLPKKGKKFGTSARVSPSSLCGFLMRS
jgi:hypothetical protein